MTRPYDLDSSHNKAATDRIMARRRAAQIEWETIGVFPDCAFAALGDSRLVEDELWLRDTPLPVLTVRHGGHGMVYGLCEEDDVPIEIGRIDGEIVAARVEFTNDVRELEAAGKATWEHFGDLKIGAERGVAIDAKQHATEWDGQYPWHHDLPLPAGTYAAEACIWDSDHVGIRLIKGCEDPSLPSRDRRTLDS